MTDVLLKQREGRKYILRLNQPGRGNVLNQDLQRALAEAWREFEEDDGLWVAVLGAEGEAFSVGHDVEELQRSQAEPAERVPLDGLFPLQTSKPVIAAVQGPCYGLGFELALSCDLRVVENGTQLGFPNQGLCVGYRVASVLLPRMTTLGTALKLLWGAEVLGAERARELRLANWVVPKGKALDAACEQGEALIHRFKSPDAFQKRLIWGLSGVPLPVAMQGLRGP